MIVTANYNDNGVLIGATREDGVSGGLEFIASCEALGMAVTYKTSAVLDAEALQKAKDDKIAAIDAQTSLDIVALAGDRTKQMNLIAYSSSLQRKESLSTATPEEIAILDSLDTLWGQVKALRDSGNAREALVPACTTIAEVEAV